MQASDQEILGLAELMKDFLSLINTEGVLISDFNSQSKVKIGFISTKTYSHGQELFYKFIIKIINKLVKQLFHDCSYFSKYSN